MNCPRAAALAALLLASACGCTPAIPFDPDPSRAAAAGDLASVEAVGGHSHLVLRALFWWEGLGDAIATEQGISLYRAGYWTTAPDGRVVLASGLVAFPRGHAPLRGVVSWQHGTATNRALAPSTPDPGNGVIAAAVFAGAGYLLVAPDYLGFGLSTEPHPYYHEPSAANAVVDLLRASRTLVERAGRTWPDAVYLGGFSQGGHATVAAQRALEAAAIPGLTVRASAPVAGAYDLAGIELPAALEGRSRFASLYIAWIALSLGRIHGDPLDAALRAPWPERAAALFDGDHDGAAVVAALPAQPRDLVTPAFAAAVANGGGHWLMARLAENSPLDWTPRAPMRLYYGEADADVAPADAVRFAERMRARGADVEAVSVGPLAHEPSLLAAAPLVRAWFDALSARAR